jgi:hypothetical protein
MADVRWVAVSRRYPELAYRKFKRGLWFHLPALVAIGVMPGLVFGPQVFQDPKFQKILADSAS